MNTGALLAIVVATAGMNFSCSSTTAPAPEKGTPAYSWAAAKETFAANDYVKTTEHLDKLLADENEFTARALPWSLILTSGTAAGYAELADNYELGGRLNKSDPTAFRRRVRCLGRTTPRPCMPPSSPLPTNRPRCRERSISARSSSRSATSSRPTP